MCGIIGYAGRDAVHAVDDVRDGVRRLEHRGPDASGLSQLDGCVLGHTRLRIIDTRAAADQPMRLAHAGLTLAFNGEIYNFQELRAELHAAGHRFTTTSDTEVILHLYEEDDAGFLERLEGMFAFALWDERRRRLVLARDRLGIKPLYYRLTGEGIAFASEVGCLASARSTLRPSAIASYLRVGWVGGPETIYSDVYELLPSRRLVWQDGRSSVTRYWPAPDAAWHGRDPSTQDLSSAVRDAVRRQLVADVPLGLFLSAGVDSAVLARLVSQEAPGARAFTVAFDTGPDEVADASLLAERLRLHHTVVPVSSASILADLDGIVSRMGQPTVDGVNSWVISRAVREAGLVVALSGLGGDELFRGYSTFRHAPRIARVGRLARHVPRSLRTPAVRALAHAGVGPRVLRASEAALHGGHRAAYAAVRGLFSVRDLERLWPDIRSVLDPAEAMLDDGHLPGGTGPVTRLEMANYLPYQLLRDTDVMSMAHALEVRVPLLDERIVDVVLRRQCAGGPPFDKLALIEAVDPALGALARRPKRTFTLPFDAWMRGALRDRTRESVLGLANTGLGLDAGALAGMWRRFEGGQLGWRPLWALAVLGEWVMLTRRSEVAA